MFGTFLSGKDMSTKYFKKEQLLLKFSGISLRGGESIFYKIYSYFIMYLVIMPYPFVACGDLFKHEFAVFAEIFVYFVGSCMVGSIMAVAFFNRLNLGKLLLKLEQEPFLANAERGGNIEETLINGWISYKEKQNLVFYVGLVVTYLYSVISTFIKRLGSNDYHDWAFGFGTITVFNVSYSPNYEILWMYQNIVVMYLICNGCAIVLILAAILTYVSVQFQIFQNNLRRMVPNSYRDMLKETETSACSSSTITEMDASTIPWKYLKISLKKAVLYHLDIINIAADLDEIFNNTILSIYLFTLAAVCFEVYRASMLSMSDVRILMLMVETAMVAFPAFLICYCGQKVTNESLNVANAAYEAYYVGVDLRFQNGLIMIIRRSQKPFIIIAGKFIETSVVTYLWIVRSAYSTCMVLRNVRNE